MPPGGATDAGRLLRELQVCRAEFRAQAEVLQAVRQELERTKARYFDLYELAPVGYCTLDAGGRLLDVNIVASTLLGVPRSRLVNQPLIRFILPQDRGIFHRHRQHLRKEGSAHVCEVSMVHSRGSHFWTRVEATMVPGGSEEPYCQTIISDITDQRKADERIHGFSHQLMAAREDERKQLSIALHHDLGSLAVGVGVHLDILAEATEAGHPQNVRTSLESCREILRASMANLKKITVGLRPPDLELLGLATVLKQHFSLATEGTGLTVRFTDALGEYMCEEETALILFRVGQEALTNVVRHAWAKNVYVRLSKPRAGVRISVRDDGCGFDAPGELARPTEAMGLISMHEMALSAGGSAEIDSSPGSGTRVTVTLPYATREQ